MRRSIVCGVDGSDESRRAASVAADLARQLDLRLVLAHAADDPPSFPYKDPRLTELQRRRGVEAVQRLFSRLAEELRIMPETRIVYGDPVDALNLVSGYEQAELLVVGSRGRSGIAAALWGSVSTRLASTGHRPVLVVSPEAGAQSVARERPGGTVVCGVDGSVEAARALRLTFELAERLGLAPLPVHAAGRRAAEPPYELDMQVEAEVGDPVDVLRSRGLDADARLIVVGSRGRGPVRGALLGSVSASLAASAPAPVLVVPGTADLGVDTDLPPWVATAA